jgi:hypothetical protein
MIIIGLLLLIAGLIFGGELVFSNHHRFSDPLVFGQHLGIHGDAGLFVVGVITGAGMLAGLGLIVAGTRRKAARALAHRHEQKEAKGTQRQRDRLVARNEELQAKLTPERSAESDSSAIDGQAGSTRIERVETADP